jgi:pilus assembly protein CpaC
MHPRKNRMEAWIGSAILVLSVVPCSVIAQEAPSSSGLRRAMQTLGRALTGPEAQAAAEPQDEEEAAPATSKSAETDQGVTDTRKLSLVISQSKTITLPDFAKRVKIDNPSMVDARVDKSNPKALIVTAVAAKPGVAQITVTDRNGQNHRINVTITQDAGPLQQAVEDMFPDANVRAIPAGDGGVAIVGYVDNPQSITAILDLAEKFYPGGVINGLKAVGPQQVQLRVMIAEVNRTKLRSLGVNFFGTRSTTGGRTTYFDSIVGGLVTETADPNSPIGIGFSFSDQSNILFGKLGQRHEFRAFIRALKEEGLAKIIAEPTLVTFSGRAASMVVGGEFPIVVPQQQGTFSIEFREYGNRLEFVPVVLGGGRIRLEVRPELSQLDYANGVAFQGFTIPGIIQRRVDTSVELNTGETFVAAGLISREVSANTSKVPYIGDVPIVGAAFRTVSYTEVEKELVVVVTPELVEPLRPGQKPCNFPGSESTHPSNGELFWNGNIEAPACNPCEISRRAELGITLSHAKRGLPCCPEVGVHGTAAKKDTEASLTGEVAEAETQEEENPQAQRPEGLPGLIGPLGYEAGR